ncbi:Holliday junction DNA helicase RuvB [Candidatus Roizmanbacteria bacterium RIFCSPLOWO2_02_FULL_38_10]|uniref:Holliday junction branch migration complex subunit RuvB n=1 Tax=Candidatus Roizmanbacteria bacterium RIFCSPLOWO2_02_FULL_38_10 TaxID=1802074 RepID=A0A1F7JP50_9BACT|nr:MAG: Holliday junction DNA helicase RuvB [Candidatus Roizmanbacteria bacterium RIFCSPLOWO2_02_FULL_38_10]
MKIVINNTVSETKVISELRPHEFKDYIGQAKVVRAVKLFVQAVIERGTVNEHILLYGPPGIGKTTLANIIARELKGNLKVTSGPALTKTGDLAAILTNLKDNDVLFIDEIHRLPKPVEEALYPVMEDFFLDIIIGKGPSARTVRLPIPKITIVGATTRVALLSAPLRDRFGMVLRLDYYTDDEMIQIIMRSAKILKLPLIKELAGMIAQRSRKTPRVANRIVKRVKDFYQVHKLGSLDRKSLLEVFNIIQIDEMGLNDVDNEYLRILVHKFSGGPAGASTLATALSDDIQTVEEYIEPYLIRTGFIRKTGRGRVATDKAYKHLKVTKTSAELQAQRTLV